MIRLLLVQFLLFLLPFACYAAWLWLSKKTGQDENWSRGPIAWLTLAGLLLAIAGVSANAIFNTSPEGMQYRPSTFQDGVFVPGRFEETNGPDR